MSYVVYSLLLFLCHQFQIFSINGLMNCTTANPCISQIKGCGIESDDCILQCYGAASCDDVTYNCNSNDAQKPCKMLCYGEGSCENAVYTSSNTQSAVLECNNLNACTQLKMTSIGSTTVKCQGIKACKGLVVTVDSTFSQNNIECHDFANSCQDVKISVNGGSLGNQLSCMGTDGQCSSVIFNCTGTTGNCAVDCAALESCDTSQIICNSNNICTSNQENAFEVIGGEIIPTTSPSIAPTIPAVLYPSKFPTHKPTLQIQPSTHKPTANPTHKNTASHDGLSDDDNPNNNSNTYENIFQTKHLLSVFGILCMSLIILFIVICVLCIFMIKFKNTIKTIKSEKAQDDHDYDSELQIENTNPNSNLNKTDSITDEQKLQNDDEKQYFNNSVPIVNGSDSDSESDSEAEELYGPIAQNEKTKMEIQMSYMFKIEKMKSWFNQKIKLQNDYYELFVDNGYETLELIQLLSEDKLRKIGITKQGHVDKIMMEINSLKKGLASNVQEGINIYDDINTSSKTLMHL